MRHIGVDGCRSGWLAVTRYRRALRASVEPDIRRLVEAFPSAERIFIDIPIGLPSPEMPVRLCDSRARALLVARRSSVFPVPCREALSAGTLDAARLINKQRLDRSIGAQTWNISAKIAQVDAFLCADPDRCRTIREIHPEVCFWALAGGRPMKHNKKTREGQAERLRVLKVYEPAVESFLNEVLSRTRRKDLVADDVLDAVVAFVTAEARRGEVESICDEPARDAAGLPIDMVYRRVA